MEEKEYLKSDDGGTHIVIAIDNHKNSNKILDVFSSRFNDSRVIVMKVPEGSLYNE